MDDKTLWAVVSAVIAATASIISLMVNIFVAYRKEERESYRSFLKDDLKDISSNIHQIMSAAAILTKARTETSAKNWRSRAAIAGAELDKSRIRTRYHFHGISDGFRTLRRVPNWVEHIVDRDPASARKLVDLADDLRIALDNAVFDAFSNGRRPSCGVSKDVRKAAWQTEAFYRNWQTGYGRDVVTQKAQETQP